MQGGSGFPKASENSLPGPHGPAMFSSSDVLARSAPSPVLGGVLHGPLHPASQEALHASRRSQEKRHVPVMHMNIMDRDPSTPPPLRKTEKAVSRVGLTRPQADMWPTNVSAVGGG